MVHGPSKTTQYLFRQRVEVRTTHRVLFPHNGMSVCVRSRMTSPVVTSKRFCRNCPTLFFLVDDLGCSGSEPSQSLLPRTLTTTTSRQLSQSGLSFVCSCLLALVCKVSIRKKERRLPQKGSLSYPTIPSISPFQRHAAEHST